MRAVIQRVTFAEVIVNENSISKIDNGILTFLAIEKGDTENQLVKLIEKINTYRIFEDEHGKMNLSVIDKNFEHLIISQFTLAADTQKGRRPSFTSAEVPDVAEKLYLKSIEISKSMGVKTFAGQFQADMKITLTNDGPVTFLLES